METDMVPNPKKSGKTQKTQDHEFCHGYADKNGIWSNGFYCRRWGKPDDKYCCEDLDVRICCPEPPPSTRPLTYDHVTFSSTPSVTGQDSQGSEGGSSIFLPILIGSGVGVVLIVFCLLVVCLVCRCCDAGKKRNNKPIPGNKRLSFSVEAEATSAVIAAQALQKEELQQQQHKHQLHQQQQQQQQLLLGHDSKTHSCSGEDGALHCGCRWSPSTSRSTVVDLDSLIATMQQNITNSWQQQEMETTLGHPVNCSCDQHGRPYNPLLNPQNKRMFSNGDRSANGNVSPTITTDPFRPPSLNTSTRQPQQHYFSMDDNSMRTIHLNTDHGSHYSDRGLRYNYPTHNQMNELRQIKCIGHDCSDRQRRDSGVLVEEPDVIMDTNSSSLAPNKFSSPPPQLFALNQR